MKIVLAVVITDISNEASSNTRQAAKPLLKSLSLKSIPTMGTQIIFSFQEAKSFREKELLVFPFGEGEEELNNDAFSVIPIFRVEGICYFVDRDQICLFSEKKFRTEEEGLYQREKYISEYGFAEVMEA